MDHDRDACIEGDECTCECFLCVRLREMGEHRG